MDTSSRDTISGLIAQYRDGGLDAERHLIEWLYSYVQTFVRANFTGTREEREDMNQELIAWLIEGLPKIISRIELDRNPCGYLLTSLFYRMRRLLEILGRLPVFEVWEMDEYWIHHPYGQARPDDLVAAAELRKLARRTVVESVQTFRLPLWRATYTGAATYWLRTGTERVAQGTPRLVKSAVLYHLRTTVRVALVRDYVRHSSRL